MSANFLKYREAFDYPNSPLNRWSKYDREVIPLWVADMDFAANPAIVEAMLKRVKGGHFGYVSAPKSFYQLVKKYCQEQYDWQIDSTWIVTIPGVVPGLAGSVNAVTEEGAPVLVPRPVYAPFFEVVEIANRSCKYLPFDNINGRIAPKKSAWSAADAQLCKLLLWCHPHNPGGTVYTTEETEQLATWLLANNSKGDRRVVVSDEIHADIGIKDNYRHVPLAKHSAEVADRCITLMSPGKAYNIPSVGMAFAIISNAELRQRFKTAMSPWQLISPLSLEAVTVCLTEGQNILAPKLQQIRSNIKQVADWAKVHADSIVMIYPEASYLIWMKCLGNTPKCGWVEHFVKHGVGVNGGELYRGEKNWIRLNVGTELEILLLALSRMSLALADAKITTAECE